MSYKSYQVRKKGIGLVEMKQVILHEEGKMDDGITFSRSQGRNSIEESIDIKNAIMVQFSPNRIFTAAIILLRYAPPSLSPSLRPPPLWTAACWQRSLCLGFAPAPVTTILLSSSVGPMHDFISFLV